MSFSAPDPGRTETTTARLVLAGVNRAHGGRFRLLNRLNGGFQSGTWLVRDSADGASLAVLKWSARSSGSGRLPRAAAAVERAAAGGYRTPAWLAAGVTGDGFPYNVQEFVPGSPARRLTAGIAGKLVPLLESQRGLDADPEHCWSRYVRERLDGTTVGVRRGMAGPGARGHRFSAAIDALLAVSGDVELPAHDLVHGDFRLANILFPTKHTPTAVDIEALGSGTRAYDYATLLTEDDVDPAGWDLIRDAGEQVAGPAVLAHCFALAALELVDFVRLRVPERLPVVIGPLTDRAAALTPPRARHRTTP
ncbi:phosphotransferase [Streptomyces sp. NPDC088725]|uniref:phosphotransferase n=1 Tax=Streptomyces sp. NPDC088725 TaxID=3365873 RepID=UPI003818D9FF